MSDSRAREADRLPFRTRLTLALSAVALLPLLAFGALALVLGLVFLPSVAGLGAVLLVVLLVVALLTVPLVLLLVGEILRPLRTMVASVDRVSAGDLSEPVLVPGDDELGRLADSHNRLAADLQRRSVQVGRMLEAIGAMSPSHGVEALVQRASLDAARAFDLIEARVVLGSAADHPQGEVIPGESRPLRAELRAGEEALGVLVGLLPATRGWSRADQDLLELFASEVAVALRNAQLFATVESQNAQLRELDAAKDAFLRGVSHNLQSPLTSIRAYADQLATDRPDRRLEIIAEQSERLSRMVRQLLTVSRLESGAIKPRSEVMNLATRARRAWEALGAGPVPFSLNDESDGWLAIADSDQLDQVLWALLDNAVKYGGGAAIRVDVRPEPARARLRLMITDHGPGVKPEDRLRLFERFERGREQAGDGGSGLGLYVSRELCRAMGGELVIEPAGDAGAAFTVELPAEQAHEG